MSISVTWQGLYPAVTTQFKADESLDLPATQKEIEALLVGPGEGEE